MHRSQQTWLLWFLLCAASAALGTGYSPLARAQIAGEPGGYRELIDEALREFEAQNFQESRSLFKRAHQLFPNARTLRGVGMVEFELRNYGDCIESLQRALASQVKPLEGALREETERLLARAQGFVARLMIDVRPEAARVLLDGAPLSLAPNTMLTLEVGDHVLELSAEGYAAEKRALKVLGGEQEHLTVVLIPLRAERKDPAERPAYKSPWLWAGIGVLVAGAAAGTTLALTQGGSTKREPPYAGTADTVLTGPTR